MSSAFDVIHEVPVPIVKQPVHKVVVPDPDVHIFGISHPNHVDIIQSPLAQPGDAQHGHHGGSDHGNGPQDSHHGSVSSASDEKGEQDPEEPVLKKAHEAPTIQLFFDLYFVANLTTFSAQHDIHNANELRSYLGYFTMIWFTWFQNTMFDVRFSNDSVFERICKACQFGVMTGFAITGPGYQTGFEEGSGEALLAVSAFKTLSLILMTSRLILAFQYGIAFVWLRDYKKARLPMLGHIVIMFCSAMIFLGLFFAFSQKQTETVLAGWYITFVLEAALVNLISGNTHFLSFRSTVLVERLGLLTLIILGEGIISMSNALNSVGTDNDYSPAIIGQIICCVVVTYLMYMLYFDNVQPERMGNLRQHIWAILHFPLHASIVLVVEAQAQLAIWQKVIEVSNPIVTAVQAVSIPHPTQEEITALNETVTSMKDRFLTLTTVTAASFITLPNETDTLAILSDATSSSSENETAVRDALDKIEADALQFLAGKFNIEVEGDPQGQEAMNAIFQLFEVVYVYFLAFAGFVLIVLSILFVIGKRNKLRGEILAVVLRFCAGLGLSLMSTMAAPGLLDPTGFGNDNLHRYMYSGMVIPTVLLIFLAVLVLDNLLIRYIKSVVHWRLHLPIHKNIPAIERSDLSAQDDRGIGSSLGSPRSFLSIGMRPLASPRSPKSPRSPRKASAEGDNLRNEKKAGEELKSPAKTEAIEGEERPSEM